MRCRVIITSRNFFAEHGIPPSPVEKIALGQCDAPGVAIGLGNLDHVFNKMDADSQIVGCFDPN